MIPNKYVDPEELKIASRAIFLAASESVAEDISRLLLGAADEIEYLHGKLDSSIRFRNRILDDMKANTNKLCYDVCKFYPCQDSHTYEGCKEFKNSEEDNV